MNAVPAHILARRGTGTIASRAAAAIGGAAPPRISLAGNRFTVIDAAGNTPIPPSLYVDVVIVDANEHMSKIYYRDAYSGPNDNSPPTCWSDNGTAPSKDAAEPQSPTCASCRWQVWGSATSKMTGQPIRACSDAKKIAVIHPQAPFPLQVRIPPASLKAFAAYVRTVSATNLGDRSADLADLVTRVSFETGQQGVLKFEAVGYAPEQALTMLDELLEGTKLDEIVGRTDEPRTEALPPPAAAAPLPPSQQHFPTGAPLQQQAPLPPQYQGFQAPPQTGQWAPAPAPAFAPAPNGFAVPAAAPPVSSFGTPASPTPATTGFAQPASQEPAKRKRRTKAEIEADNAAKNGEVLPPDHGPANPETIPAFLKPRASEQPTPQYGFTQPMAAPPDMQAALDAAMGALPTA